MVVRERYVLSHEILDRSGSYLDLQANAGRVAGESAGYCWRRAVMAAAHYSLKVNFFSKGLGREAERDREKHSRPGEANQTRTCCLEREYLKREYYVKEAERRSLDKKRAF